MRIPGIPYHQGRNSYSDKDGKKYGIAIHNTSNTASDTAEANYADHRTDGVSAHLYVDGDSVTQSLDTKAKAGHAGSAEGNENALAVEIRGLNSWSRQQWLDGVAWGALGRVLAWCIRNGVFAGPVAVRHASAAEMRTNPKVGAFYGHDDMRRAWGGTTHTDPGPNFPWDRLLGAVSSALGATPDTSDREDEDDDMKHLIQWEGSPAVFLSDGVTALHLASEGHLNDVVQLGREGLIRLANTTPRVVGRRELIGRIVGKVPAGFEDLAATVAPTA